MITILCFCVVLQLPFTCFISVIYGVPTNLGQFLLVSCVFIYAMSINLIIKYLLSFGCRGINDFVIYKTNS